MAKLLKRILVEVRKDVFKAFVEDIIDDFYGIGNCNEDHDDSGHRVLPVDSLQDHDGKNVEGDPC